MEPRFNEPLNNKVLGITDVIPQGINQTLTLQHLTLNSPIVISKDFVVIDPEGSETVTKAVMYGAFRLRQALELTPTDSFHFISSNCQKQISMCSDGLL